MCIVTAIRTEGIGGRIEMEITIDQNKWRTLKVTHTNMQK